MKKIYFLLFAFILGINSNAQTIPGGDMENWRNSVSGSIVPDAIHAPVLWYGEDSLIIADGEAFSFILGVSPASWLSQLFEESTIVHGGAHSAKVISVFQDSLLGNFPGVLSNAQAVVTIDIVTMTLSSFKYVGGTAVSQKPASVSAWVQYYPGKDSTGATGADTGFLTVQAVSHIGSVDSVIGTGTVVIPPYSSWQQITDSITYPLDTTDLVDTLRIVFSSGGGGLSPALDSSILYVDDVTMTGVSQDTTINNAVRNITGNNDLVKIYPNPVSGTLYFDAPQNAGLNYQIFTTGGQSIISNTLAGNDELDVSALPAGLYFYTITDKAGNIVQRGKVSVL